MSLVDGPAGTAKTYIAVYAALEMLRDQSVDLEKIVYIRSIVESADKSLGSLPGEIDDKFSPYMMPLIEKVTELCGPGTCGMLKSKGLIDAIPVNFVRGLTFNNTCVIVDESQNLTKGELTTILTRFGRNSRYIVLGDGKQSDVKQSGFKNVFDRFNSIETESIIKYLTDKKHLWTLVVVSSNSVWKKYIPKTIKLNKGEIEFIKN